MADKITIDVVTLDSVQCAACGYMMNMAVTANEKYSDKIEIIEHKFTEKESVARAVNLGLEHLPALLINGKLIYSSIIPSQEDYFAELDKYL